MGRGGHPCFDAVALYSSYSARNEKSPKLYSVSYDAFDLLDMQWSGDSTPRGNPGERLVRGKAAAGWGLLVSAYGEERLGEDCG